MLVLTKATLMYLPVCASFQIDALVYRMRKTNMDIYPETGHIKHTEMVIEHAFPGTR